MRFFAKLLGALGISAPPSDNFGPCGCTCTPCGKGNHHDGRGDCYPE